MISGPGSQTLGSLATVSKQQKKFSHLRLPFKLTLKSTKLFHFYVRLGTVFAEVAARWKRIKIQMKTFKRKRKMSVI